MSSVSVVSDRCQWQVKSMSCQVRSISVSKQMSVKWDHYDHSSCVSVQWSVDSGQWVAVESAHTADDDVQLTVAMCTCCFPSSHRPGCIIYCNAENRVSYWTGCWYGGDVMYCVR